MDKNTINSENEKWSQLKSAEREQITLIYREYGKYFTEVLRSLSDMLFNWLFILNSGGLVAVTSMLASMSKSQFNLENIKYVGAFFAIGIIITYIALNIEHYRFSKQGKINDSNFELLQNDNHLLGKTGDMINAVLTGCAFNLKKIMRLLPEVPAFA